MRNNYKTMDYQHYLTTVHWEKTRARKVAQVNYKCEKCSRTSGLEVHHLTYARLGEERLEDLQVLCPVCHRKAHEIEPTARDWQRGRLAFGHETLEAHKQMMAQRRMMRDLEGRV